MKMETRQMPTEARQDLATAFAACADDQAKFDLFASVDAAQRDAPINTISDSAVTAWNNAPNHHPATLVRALAGAPSAKVAMVFGLASPEGQEPGSEHSL